MSNIPKISYLSVDDVSLLVEAGFLAERHGDEVVIADPEMGQVLVDVRKQSCSCADYQQDGACLHPSFANSCLRYELI